MPSTTEAATVNATMQRPVSTAAALWVSCCSQTERPAKVRPQREQGHGRPLPKGDEKDVAASLYRPSYKGPWDRAKGVSCQPFPPQLKGHRSPAATLLPPGLVSLVPTLTPVPVLWRRIPALEGQLSLTLYPEPWDLTFQLASLSSSQRVWDNLS